ncbi:MarR family transcriptional regulator [Mesobaculum littorinae]|uniref:MarR family transcriptional regulator n=1 Tax=Mesobaculum littorinae TaxID=2486419 RepID=A0A438AJF1_9RHOB|nr:MarR family transcriptional regulator [Mesobaculum littorinae]RVV98808.1 MarR family transcriptional regulator [Mesobaculum littorinae]
MTAYSLHDSLGYRLSLASRLQERRLDEQLKTLGLTRIMWCVLLGVGNEGLTQPSDLAQFVGIDRTATSRALKQMEAMGLVERQSGKTDRRTTRVGLTAAGRDALDAGVPMAQANNEMMDAKLSPAERQDLRRLLARITEGEPVSLPQL